MREEPIAIVGLGCMYPQAAGKEAFWRRLVDRDPCYQPVPMERYWLTEPCVEEALARWHGAFFEELSFDYKRFRIPPAYRKAVSKMMLTLLRAVEECVHDAGYKEGDWPRDDVDVYCGSCFGFDSTFANALKVEGVRVAHELIQAANADESLESLLMRLQVRFGTSSHDKVGEMASSMPARIASLLSLRGQVQCMESADATGYALLEAALVGLRSGKCNAAIVTAGQRLESPLLPLALEKKGFLGCPGARPFDEEAQGVPIGEGATALLLKRLSDAERDGNRIYSVLGGIAAAPGGVANGFRYSADTTRAQCALSQACRQAGLSVGELQYVDCVLPGIGDIGKHVVEALAAQPRAAGVSSTYLGSSVTAFGYTLANSALTAVAAVSLAMEREELPGMTSGPRTRLPLPGGLSYCDGKRSWKSDSESGRTAGIIGSSVTGLNWQLVLLDRVRSQILVKQANLTSHPVAKPEPIAIVGLGGAFGSTADSAEFWNLLRNGVDSIRPVPDSVLPRALYFSGGSARALSSYAEYGSDLRYRDFEAASFRIFPKRAAAMDRAQQHALGVAAEALADYRLEDKRDRVGRVGVFIGTTLTLNRERQLVCDLHRRELVNVLQGDAPNSSRCKVKSDAARNGIEIDQFTLDGCLASGAASLISNCFSLDAVPVAVEAACASSMAALSNAILTLRQGRYDLIVAGGVELPVNARDIVLCASQMMLSRERIAPFAEGADGFSPGDGAGMFVLKRLSDATRDGDHVYACITGIGASADAVSMTAPDVDGQSLAISRAFKQAGYTPATVQYVEAHGTGTRLGDIAEVSSINSVYKVGRRNLPLRIGSVKSNIGHTFAASGSAGLLKTVLAMHHGTLPPTILRGSLNNKLPLDKVPAQVVTAAEPWRPCDGRRRAGVSSFGTGGINFHLLLESVDDSS
ncbi:polyketide synthase [Vreelandella titanicae]|uniref:beta-ketoacyl [acyl carrier protein] synthase domain-containing protein n=1 Tax=Vreelandella titanicae TaxID=664683 RepID=UPI0024203F7D|nr:polyketide synthase [Halomonas titanicae]UEQ05308.1 polyketide synthase [Halomonas profundus]